MSLVVFEHHPLETSVLLGAMLLRHGHRLRVVKLHEGESVPVDLDDVDGIISMGGPMNVDEADRYPWMDPEMAYLCEAHAAGLPCIGICLGAQLMAKAMGGQVQAMAQPEVGWGMVRLSFAGSTDPVLTGVPWQTMQFHMHGQHIVALPVGAVTLASSKACPIQAFRAGLKSYGFQFHFEWDERIIRIVADDPLVAAARADAQPIIDGLSQHYDSYRRINERLCQQITLLLMPIDRR